LFRIIFRKLFPPFFTISIKDGKVNLENGKLTSAFLGDFSSIARKSGISSGWIWGFKSGGGVRLEFSSGIRRGDRQRFRNTAGVHKL